VRAAQALEKAFAAVGGDREVRHVDALELTNKVFRTISKTYIDLVDKAPDVLGWLYDALDSPWQKERRRLAWDKLNTRPFVKMLERERPDLIVCTHFLPAEMVSWMKAKHKLHCPQVIVVTDFDVHAMWLCHHYEHYTVALDETREHMIKLGIPPGKVSTTGIPSIRSSPRRRTRRRCVRLGLAADKTTILLSAGGFGVRPVEHRHHAPRARAPAQIVAICGKNVTCSRMQKLAAKPTAAGVLVPVGYRRRWTIHVRGRRARRQAGRPHDVGGAREGPPLRHRQSDPRAEERNSDHLLEAGAAIRCNNLPVLAYKLDRLLDDGARVTRMRQNVARLAHPYAARDVVRIALDLAR
jgi:processive 1,2-diacylglycerol beta-glucosyltransferase